MSRGRSKSRHIKGGLGVSSSEAIGQDLSGTVRNLSRSTRAAARVLSQSHRTGSLGDSSNCGLLHCQGTRATASLAQCQWTGSFGDGPNCGLQCHQGRRRALEPEAIERNLLGIVRTVGSSTRGTIKLDVPGMGSLGDLPPRGGDSTLRGLKDEGWDPSGTIHARVHGYTWALGWDPTGTIHAWDKRDMSTAATQSWRAQMAKRAQAI